MEKSPHRHDDSPKGEFPILFRMKDDLIGADEDKVQNPDLAAEWVQALSEQGIAEIEEFLGKYAGFLHYLDGLEKPPGA